MNQELGTTIPQPQIDAVTAAAVNACQNKFNNTPDGIVQDPRACRYDVRAYVCTGPNTPANCLTPQQADSINKIWNGSATPLPSASVVSAAAYSSAGSLSGSLPLWFGLERGAPLELFDGAAPFSISTQYLQYWVFQNPAQRNGSAWDPFQALRLVGSPPPFRAVSVGYSRGKWLERHAAGVSSPASPMTI